MEDIESDVLMCCETRSVLQKDGLFGGKEEISFSAAYITPKWLVWANSANGTAASAGSAQLRNIETRDYESTAMFAIVPNRGLNITGRYRRQQDRNDLYQSWLRTRWSEFSPCFEGSVEKSCNIIRMTAESQSSAQYS